MTCFTPAKAWQLETGRVVFAERGNIAREITLPCGQCVGCRKQRAQDWAVRITHESQMHRYSWFVTFTYDESHVPENQSLDYRHFQLFLKRLRKSRKTPLRFFVAGEYGERTLRPHFHACLFGVHFPDMVNYRKSPSGFQLWKSAELDALWGLGFCSIGYLSVDSAQYCAGYINKKIIASEKSPSKARQHYARVNPATGEVHYVKPEFAVMSRNPGIGKPWFDKYKADCLPRDYCVIDGKKLQVPRYYSQLFKACNPFGAVDLELDRADKLNESAPDRTPPRMHARHLVAIAKSKLGARKL